MAGFALPSLIQARLGCFFFNLILFLFCFLFSVSFKFAEVKRFLIPLALTVERPWKYSPVKSQLWLWRDEKRRNWFLWPIFHSRSHLTSYSLLCDLRTMTFLPKIWRIYREMLDTLWLWRFLFHWYLTEYSWTRWRNSWRWQSTISLSTGHDMTFKTLLWLTTANTNHWQNNLTWLGLD